MSGLTFALPSKGRLKEQCAAHFADAGLPMRQDGGARGYSASFPDLPEIDLQLRSASEIAAGLVGGAFHLGVTGADLLFEAVSNVEQSVCVLLPLGFGRADLVVAVPQAWIDVSCMADVDDVAALHEEKTGRRMRVATKYVRQTRDFFERHGVGHYRIVESAGATEGAPASGAAEMIVDITTTGATLAGNGLKIIGDGVIRKSEACLAASLNANWSDADLAMLLALLQSLDGRARASQSAILEFDAGFDVSALGGVSVEIVGRGVGVCDSTEASHAARMITDAGGGPVRISHRDFDFRSENEQFERFSALLRGR